VSEAVLVTMSSGTVESHEILRISTQYFLGFIIIKAWVSDGTNEVIRLATAAPPFGVY
jgi:hypothetical protein